MRAREFIGEDVSTTSASIAPVAQSLGHMPMISRMGRVPTVHKYQTRKPKRTKNAGRIA
jgi:hypothetical protein